MTGNGTPTDLQGPLARMWRDVYAKAAGVAEGRTTELLKHHVYQYPHGAGGEGGGGGGGGLVELGRAVATAGQETLRVPASGALPTGYSGLHFTATGRAQATTGQRNVYLYFNDDQTTAYYNYGSVAGVPSTGAVAAVGSATASAIHVGNAPAANGAEPQTVYGLSGAVPLHENTAFPKTVQALSAGLFTAAAMPEPKSTMGVYAPSPAGPITSVHLFLTSGGWAAGATLIVYGHGPATGGGDGGAEVTITTDASLTATESPANTFALAARLSPDAGNALALRANGLFATDTGGGGGTGNTTMYTQTGTPTGAANSLWFNPSETA